MKFKGRRRSILVKRAAVAEGAEGAGGEPAAGGRRPTTAMAEPRGSAHACHAPPVRPRHRRSRRETAPGDFFTISFVSQKGETPKPPVKQPVSAPGGAGAGAGAGGAPGSDKD